MPWSDFTSVERDRLNDLSHQNLHKTLPPFAKGMQEPFSASMLHSIHTVDGWGPFERGETSGCELTIPSPANRDAAVDA